MVEFHSTFIVKVVEWNDRAKCLLVVVSDHKPRLENMLKVVCLIFFHLFIFWFLFRIHNCDVLNLICRAWHSAWVTRSTCHRRRPANRWLLRLEPRCVTLPASGTQSFTTWRRKIKREHGSCLHACLWNGVACRRKLNQTEHHHQQVEIL